MPIYEYECPKCGRFDCIQKVNDKPLKANPECKDAQCPKKAVRVMSASAFHLKGSGWYKTDYASSSSTGGGKSSSKSEASSESSNSSADKSEKKSDSTPAKKKCGSGCGCH